MEHLKLDGHIHGNTYIRIVDSYSCVNMILFRQLFLHKYKVCFNEFKIKFLGLT